MFHHFLEEMKLNKPILLLASLVISSFHFMPIVSQEVENEREFNYLQGSGKGPEDWGKIHEEWESCGKGDLQSPIDLLDKKVEVLHHLGKLNRTFKPSPASLVNRGHDIMIKWANGTGTIHMNGTEYELKQCHWHSPSEHTVNGARYTLEAHMVHESIDKKIAVIGILYRLGRPDPFLSEMMDHINGIAVKEAAEKVVGLVNPRHIHLKSKEYYRYRGSLTTPPCTEGVMWTILKKVRTVSRKQVKLLRMAVHDDMEMNARPTQPTNFRAVHFYRPEKF